MNNSIIPIFFSIDNSYAPYLAVALNSAIKNSSPDRRYKAIILHQSLSKQNIEKLSMLKKENFDIEFYEMKKGLEDITNRSSNYLRCDYFTLTIYYRLFIPKMFPQYDKAIYLDSDIAILSDLSELYDTNLENKYIGACRDMSVSDVPELVRYMEECVGVPAEQYVNSGVLLLNLKELRERKFDELFLALLNAYHLDTIAPDQDYINAMCNGKILYLGEAWNTMPKKNGIELIGSKLIHYNLFSKPWCYDNIPYQDNFWKYAKDCGFWDEIVKNKLNYSDAQKEKDAECLKSLISKGASFCNNEITFKNLYKKGVKVRL